MADNGVISLPPRSTNPSPPSVGMLNLFADQYGNLKVQNSNGGIGNFLNVMGGWISFDTQPTYGTASTIVFTGQDLVSLFPTGTKLWFVQNESMVLINKFFYVLSAVYAGGNTTLTVTAGTDYTVTNNEILSFKFAYGVAYGFPEWFAYVPTYIQYGTMTYTSITTHEGKFYISGKTLYFRIDSAGTLGGTPTSVIYFTAPVVPNPVFTGTGFVYSLGVVTGGVLRLGFGSSNSVGSVFYASLFDKSNFSLGAIRFVGGGFYEI